MLIGDLSRACGVSPRLLRYYEEQGLLLPGRDAKGYRVYGEDAPVRVARIRELLSAGMSTEDIRGLLPCLRDPTRWVVPCDESLGIVEQRYAELDGKIAELARKRALLGVQRDAIRGWLARE
ncbi:MerR family transcriptional regulator [Nocardia bhagyanarayanae]|uniref:DNA-binding transcriptional MerR regulator n=1 Tax=Nocardia bhagyanarayanae TaxID=1215925 RepID=A0A543FB84_9NOCA|nr:MerR family transcriptional regulator [Nocardia bhagyanarayanae]TQM31040.1 DNA-binding transcriptional MerR regulator [Nocardia bhagyanarayanae]